MHFLGEKQYSEFESIGHMEGYLHFMAQELEFENIFKSMKIINEASQNRDE